MSFDVFFQRFRDGDAANGGGDVMRQVLAPYTVNAESNGNYLSVACGDGTADVYLSDGHMMANHVTGDGVWQLLVEGAAAAD